jgi:hypothetical protein
MLATRVLQKEGAFYFIAYKASELLDRVSFSSRYYFEGEQIEPDEPGEDEVARFIAGIEKSEKSFQRLLNRRKIRQIVNFYETAVSQPLIPGTILLFTDETLRFRRSDSSESVGFVSIVLRRFISSAKNTPSRSIGSKFLVCCLTARARISPPKCS